MFTSKGIPGGSSEVYSYPKESALGLWKQWLNLCWGDLCQKRRCIRVALAMEMC